MSLTHSARTSVAARYRSRELSGDQRAGAWSRREVRRLQQQWLRRRWRVVAWIALGVVLACVLVEVFVPSQIRSYVVGALLASAAWWVYCLMITTGGLAGKIAGINAEAFTASELRRLCRRGWRLVNHVMFESWDIDHVLLGCGGFFAVETKFRSSWSDLERDVAKWARTATEAADDVWLRLGLPKTKVRALVVLYGGDITDLRPEPFEIEGVTFCTGADLRDCLALLTLGDVPAEEVARACKRLEENVKRRDGRENDIGGEIPRQVVDSVQDLLVTTICATAVLMIVSYAMTLFSSVLWAAPTALVLLAAAIWFRRTLPTSPRVQRGSTAVVTVAAFMGTLVLVVWAIDFVRR